MSDEDEEFSEGFSASEIDWKPANIKGGESSDDDDSDFAEDPNATRSGRGSRNKNRGAGKGAISKKKKPNGQSLKSKLYNKSRPPSKPLSNSPSASTSRSASKNTHKPNENRNEGNDSCSEQSVSPFFDTFTSSKILSSGQVSLFDGKPEPKHLSDSGSEDDNESSTEDHQRAVPAISSLLDNSNRSAKAKAVKSKLVETQDSANDNTQALDAFTLLGLGDTKNSKMDKNEQNQLGPSKLTKTKSTRVKRHTKTRPSSAIIKSGVVNASDSDEEEIEEVAGRRRK